MISESYAGGKLCEVGDLVLNRLKAHLGVFSMARNPGVISPDYTVLRPIDPESVAYFEMVLRSPACRRELHIRAKGIVEGFWRLYTDDFYDIRLPVPPLLEKRAIIAFIRSATFEIDHVAQVTESQITLLREYRTRLISDVVTGKLDVRGVTLPAAEEAGAPEEWNGTLDAEMAAMEDQELPEVGQRQVNDMSDEREIPAPDTGMLFYQTEDGQSRIQVRLHDDTVWLNQRLLAELYQVAVHTINEHISPSTATMNSLRRQLFGNSE